MDARRSRASCAPRGVHGRGPQAGAVVRRPATATDADVLAAATGEDPDTVCPPHRTYRHRRGHRRWPPPSSGAPAFTVADLVGEIDWPDGVDVGLVEGRRRPALADRDRRRQRRPRARARARPRGARRRRRPRHDQRGAARRWPRFDGFPVVVALNRFGTRPAPRPQPRLPRRRRRPRRGHRPRAQLAVATSTVMTAPLVVGVPRELQERRAPRRDHARRRARAHRPRRHRARRAGRRRGLVAPRRRRTAPPARSWWPTPPTCGRAPGSC